MHKAHITILPESRDTEAMEKAPPVPPSPPLYETLAIRPSEM
jgi:hypothetical protein